MYITVNRVHAPRFGKIGDLGEHARMHEAFCVIKGFLAISIFNKLIIKIRVLYKLTY
jgi:hypothetical protein